MRRALAGWKLAVLVPVLGAVPLQPAEPGLTTLSGRLFVDLNANGAYDDGEPALAGIPIEFANGERIETIATAADGSFAISVEPGLWRAALRPPEGFEYALPEGLELEVLEAGEGSFDLQIGLQPIQILQVLLQALERVPEAADPEGSEAGAPGPGVLPEVYDGPFLPTPETADPSLLPESGSPLAPRLRTLMAAGGLLGLGLVLWAAGQVLERSQLQAGREGL